MLSGSRHAGEHCLWWTGRVSNDSNADVNEMGGTPSPDTARFPCAPARLRESPPGLAQTSLRSAYPVERLRLRSHPGRGSLRMAGIPHDVAPAPCLRLALVFPTTNYEGHRPRRVPHTIANVPDLRVHFNTRAISI
jgi:hypothetical protein